MIAVVLGNGPPFPRVLVAVAQHLREHPAQRVWVQHGSTPLPEGMSGDAFVPHAHVLERMVWAEAVVCHAGSGTVLDALAAGHVPVVVPRLLKYKEHVNDHQLDLARALAQDGRVVQLLEGEDLTAAIGLAVARRTERGEHPETMRQQLENSRALVRFLQEQIQGLGTERESVRERVVWGALRALTPWVPRRRYDRP